MKTSITLITTTLLLNFTHAQCACHLPSITVEPNSQKTNPWTLQTGYYYSHESDLIRGSSSISEAAVLHIENAAGTDHLYSAVPLEMNTYHYDLQLAYQARRDLTLQLATRYVEMDMKMYSAGSSHHGETMAPGIMSHSTSGWADLALSANWLAWTHQNQSINLGLGLSLPTGDDGIKQHGTYVHYMMQPATGTWNILPSISWSATHNQLTYGASWNASISLEDQNSSGFRFGDIHRYSLFSEYQLTEKSGLTGALTYTHIGKLRRHYNGAHHHSSPPDFQSNYGGNTLDASLGAWWSLPSIANTSSTINLVITKPLHQEVNGIQLEKQYQLGLQYILNF